MKTLCSFYPKLDHDHLRNLSDRFGTPFYLYDQSVLINRLAFFQTHFGAFSDIRFATFCNSNPLLLDLLRQAGSGVLVSSLVELQLAIHTGFAPSNIEFTGPAQTQEVLRYLLKKGIHLNVDSLGQLAQLNALTSGREFGIRINLTSCEYKKEELPLNSCIGGVSRVGILEGELLEAVKLAKENGNRIRALHAYCGTNQLDQTLLQHSVRALFNLAKHFPSINLINIGGGFGVSYNDPDKRFPFEAFAAFLKAELLSFKREVGRSIKLVIEPGRSIIAPAAIHVTRILDVKERPKCELIITVDTGLSSFPRPFIYREQGQHRFAITQSEPEVSKTYDIRIAGSTLASQDILAAGRICNGVPRVGDYITFYDAGAYGYAMSSNFSGHMRPREILHSQGHYKSIREPEGLQHALALTTTEDMSPPSEQSFTETTCRKERFVA